ncbi:MAG: hypothetical protein DMF72_16005 [Acidobacteria bacterium]|nr:MAG: hypothetical protein DMF72_16005 [Acidobacteriota bacterium]
MKFEQEELDRRAAEADRARVALRRATLELIAIRGRLIEQHKSRKDEDRSKRPDRSSDRSESST